MVSRKFSFLTVNVAKTKELIVDFRIHKDQVDPITINDQKVEIITSYKYLGMYIDNDLKWSVHAHNFQAKISLTKREKNQAEPLQHEQQLLENCSEDP